LFKNSEEIIHIKFFGNLFISLPTELIYLKSGGNSDRIISLIHLASYDENCMCYVRDISNKVYDKNEEN
jgi:hypothetical protein